jgi:hypothetical protein
MATLDSLFEQFLRERRYLKNVSPKTQVWYQSAWKAFKQTQPPDLGTREVDPSTPALTRGHLTTFVVASRDRGLRPVSGEYVASCVERLLSLAARRVCHSRCREARAAEG